MMNNTGKIPPQQPQTKYQSTSQDDWGGYIDVRLSNEDKQLFLAWWETNSNDCLNWLVDSLTPGLKLGLMWDGGNNCFVSSLNGKGVLTSQKRFTLTARAGLFDEALALLCYKHYVLLEGDWGNFKPSSKHKQDWG